MTIADRKLDGGRLFSTRGISSQVPNDSSVYFGLTTGSKPVKFSSRRFSSDGNDLATWIIEGIGFTGGVPLDLINRNRVKANTVSSFTIFAGITPNTIPIETDPSVLSISYFSVSNNDLLNEVLDTEDEKWLFAPNISYIVRIQNNDTGAANFTSETTFEELLWDIN